MRIERATRSIVWRCALPAAVLLCELAACSQGTSASATSQTNTSQSTTSRPSSTADQQASAAAPALPDPCTLLTKDEAQAVLGEDVQAPEQSSLGGTVSCEYHSVKLHGGIAPYTVHIALARESQDTWNAGKQLHAKELRPATGVNADAYFLLDDLQIWSKGYTVDIGVLKAVDAPNHRKVVDDAELSIGQKVIPRVA